MQPLKVVKFIYCCKEGVHRREFWISKVEEVHNKVIHIWFSDFTPMKYKIVFGVSSKFTLIMYKIASIAYESMVK